MTDQSLNYVYLKNDNIKPESISLRSKGSFDREESIVIDIPERFQRISIYDNGLIVSEEILSGIHLFRFNKPYSETEPGVLVFE